MTLTAWVQGSPADGRFQSMAGRGDQSFRFGMDGGAGTARFADGNNGNPDVIGGFVNDGNWHLLAGTWDGSAENIYIDGALSATVSDTQSVPGNTSDFIIGGVPDYLPGRIFNGNVSEVAVFGRALTAPQLQALYYSAHVLPFITVQPADVTMAQTATGTLSVTANGTPTLQYQWYKGTLPVANSGDFSGANTATLTISGAQVSDSGSFKVVVTNNYGAVTSSVAVVTVTTAPAVVTQPTPTNIMLYAGNQITYTLGAVGAQPLAYQWYSGASRISGATSSNYTFAASGGTNNYTCVITNTFGSATSQVVTVIGQLFVPPASGVFTVNYSVGPNSANPYAGQGAYSDPGNDFWNLVPGTSGAASGLALSSASNTTLVTLTLNFGFNNTGLPNGNAPNGSPGYLVASEDAVNGGAPGIGTQANPKGQFIVNDLPQGRYSLYIYAANFDGDRGSLFTLNSANGGVADRGIIATTNSSVNAVGAVGAGTDVFAEGDNYVLFHDVRPDPAGTITGTYIPNPNPLTGQNGEAPFNGLQLALHLISIVRAPGGNVIVTWSGGSLYSAPTVFGPWNPVAGTSPLTLPASGSVQFFRVD